MERGGDWVAARGQRGHRACNTHLSGRAQAEGPRVSPRDLSPRDVGCRTVSPFGSCALAVLGPSARTWTPEATGPGSGSFPVLGSVPSLSLDSPLRAECLLCSPLPPNREAPARSETASKAEKIQEHFIFHPAGWQEKATKGQWAYPSPSLCLLPSYKTGNSHTQTPSPP